MASRVSVSSTASGRAVCAASKLDASTSGDQPAESLILALRSTSSLLLLVVVVLHTAVAMPGPAAKSASTCGYQ